MELESNMKRLIALQRCDGNIAETQERMVAIPGRLEALENRISEIRELQAEESRILEAEKHERRTIERKVDDIEAKINKSKSKLLNIKSNKEYQTALHEIASVESEKWRLEEILIGLLEKIENYEKNLKANVRKGEVLQQECAEEKDAIQAEGRRWEDDLRRLEAERADLRLGIDPEVLQTYDRVRAFRKGIVVSAVVKGICQGCYLSIPPQQFYELIKGEDFMTCPNCKRIVYWGEDVRYVDLPVDPT